MKSLNIYHDFNLGLKFYTIPNFFLESLNEKYVGIKFIDIHSNNINNEDVELFFGNRIRNCDLKFFTNLKWIHLGCVGYDSLDLEYLKKHKILLTNSSGLMTNSMVEQAINFITSFSRSSHRINQLRNNGELNREKFDSFFHEVTNLNGKKILICGYGEVGKKLVKILDALQMEIFVISRNKKTNFKTFKVEELPFAVQGMDFVINLFPMSNDLKHVFNKKVFSKMNNSFFINIGRGQTVNESELINAIKNKNLLGAALDVFEKEPLEKNNELFKYDNIILTPHIAGLDSSYWIKQLELFTHNLESYILNNLELMKNRIK